MADSVATRVARHRAKKQANGVTRLTLEFDRAAVTALRRLCRAHGKTQRQLIELAIMAADSLLAGRLQVAKAVVKPIPCVIIRKPREHAQAPDQVNGNPNATTPPESLPIAQQHEPEQSIDDADARIRAAAFVVEP